MELLGIDTHDGIVALGFLFGGWMLGWILETILLRQTLHLLGTRGWAGEPHLRSATRGSMVWGFTLAGLYLAARYVTEDSAWILRVNLSFKVLFICFASLYFSRCLSALIRYYTEIQTPGFPSSSILVNVARIIALSIGFIILLNALGISITPILTALGVGGLAVALALQDTLSNLFAGLQILASRKFSVGDIIKLETGEEGMVEDITWRNTSLRTFRNTLILIPNAKVASAIVTNYDKPTTDFLVSVDCLIGYDSDLELAEKLALKTATSVIHEFPEYNPASEPSVNYIEFKESGIAMRIFLPVVQFRQQPALKHIFIKRLHTCFKENGIEIPLPKRIVFTAEMPSPTALESA
ncbi:MAG: mechanosensitive ion channel family protein [Sphingobacteriia bacterium]|nr:mechanosensitive ion channel family protein [Sphingobacteriia bacterium]